MLSFWKLLLHLPSSGTHSGMYMEPVSQACCRFDV